MKTLALAVFILATVHCFAQDLQCLSPSRFYIPAYKANWFKATEHCNSLGMRLAVITTAEDNFHIIEAIKSSSIYNETRTQVWIAGSDLAQKGEFIWQPTGTWFSYTRWMPGQPDNAGGIEHCTEIRHIPALDVHWLWNDLYCADLHNFVCENAAPRRVVP
ncbi:perlucin-like [Topomyia yanbarensis]|uniref:perlucin-like n=1 Tax=Topomyia yanbarensis TaxID=2498891 RepID=UPI00273AAD79|nr:perlucin-like [Topomyia yanbarensis]